MTPTTLETLFAMNREDISLGGDVYRLNERLNLPPWYPPAVHVWLSPDDPPDYESGERRELWFAVRDLLNELHAEHRRRHDNDE